MLIALVTGATAGFGKAICETLIKNGYRVIGCGRRNERLEQMRQQLGENFYPLSFDLQDKQATTAAIESLPTQWREIAVLVNNAGLALGLEPAPQALLSDWEQMVATNISGTIILTRLLLPAMVARQSGIIVNLGSIAGSYPYPGGNVYGATKAFIKQFSLNLRADLAGTKVRVTNIEPGMCGGTEFSGVRFKGDQAKVDELYRDVEYISAQDIANTLLWIVQQPAHLNINRIEIMPVAQSFSPLHVSR